ncbi:MAG TPA: ATP-binding protein [Dehalococcoidia bacterium]|nr:ATP-binding protein [Dehalococcoidia bacterium]
MDGGVIVTVGAYVAVVLVAALVVIFSTDHDWRAWAILAGIVVLLGAATLALLAPRLRNLDELTATAQALAAGRADARVIVEDGVLAPLAVALNAAAATFERTVGMLRLERAQLDALLNASSDAIVAVDRIGRIVYRNEAVREIFGAAAPTENGRPFIEVVRDHDLNELITAAAQRGERSVRVVAYGPAQRWLQAMAVPIEGGGEWAALAVFHDLTEVRRLDSVRRDFISNVSHELRTPLAGIRAAAETLQEGALDDPSAAAEFLGHIQRETDRMTQLVEELLELSRIESGAAPMRFAQVDAATVVSDTVRRFERQAERAGLSLSASVPASPLTVIADAERLERALGNLVANAIKFTPAGGSITVSAAEDSGMIAMSVRDTGVGIEPEAQPRVFERFYKTDRGRGSGGTGLGLAIVKHIVRAHEGSVSVESQPGMGSTFTMRLPRR